MKKLILFLALFFFIGFSFPVKAAECRSDCGSIEECQRFIEECSEILSLYQDANLKNKETLKSYQTQISRFEQMIASAGKKINQLEREIEQQEKELANQKLLLKERVRRLYIYQRGLSFLAVLFSSRKNTALIRRFFYQRMVANEDKRAIEDLSKQLTELAEKKANLEQQQRWLERKRSEAQKQADFLAGEIKKTEAYIGTLSSRVASLTAKQKSLLAARSGTFTSSVGEVPVSKIPCSGPPGSPSFCDPGGGVWFAAFSFGAWTHRKGMSQYGAKGRAEAGQNYEEILQAYYHQKPVKVDTGGTISVSGYGNLDFENYYLLGIAEMPSSWPKEALKAQAIAARTYAYRYKKEGRTICTTEACQVFSKSKADNPPQAWKEAVEETRGMILEGVVTYYSSTAGGYLITSGWDTTDGQGGEGFASRAWESKAGSPWFYSSWYTQSYHSGSSSCGRRHPWLTSEEMADILNAWLVLNREGGDERILPETINQCPVGGTTGNPYSKEELRQKAEHLGGAFTSVSGVSVVYSNQGETNTVIFQTNRGEVSISGSEFKQAFNLRAPGYIAIRSPLYNIEKK